MGVRILGLGLGIWGLVFGVWDVDFGYERSRFRVEGLPADARACVPPGLEAQD